MYLNLTNNTSIFWSSIFEGFHKCLLGNHRREKRNNNKKEKQIRSYLYNISFPFNLINFEMPLLCIYILVIFRFFVLASSKISHWDPEPQLTCFLTWSLLCIQDVHDSHLKMIITCTIKFRTSSHVLFQKNDRLILTHFFLGH